MPAAWIGGVALACVPLAAPADVTIEERVTIGGGFAELLKLGGTTITTVSGDRARVESKMGCEGGMMRMFCPNTDSVQIIRLDRELTYEIDPKKRTYTEESFADFRRRQEAAVKQMREAQASQAQAAGGAGPDESQCDWTPPKTVVERPGEKNSFAGHPAERVVIRSTQTCSDRKTKQSCDVQWVADQWLATGDLGRAEQHAFWRRYAQKLQLDELQSQVNQAHALAFMGRYQSAFAEVAKKMAEQKGEPLRMTLGLYMGGPGCGEQAQARAGAPDGPQGERPGVGGAIAGALGGSLGESLFKRSRKKDAEAAPADAPAPAASAAAAAPGLASLFEMTTEVKSIGTARAAPDRFEIPQGFKKVQAATR